MSKIFLLLAATIIAHVHSIVLLQRNLETGNLPKIIWAFAGLIWGLVLLQQAFKLFRKIYIYHK